MPDDIDDLLDAIDDAPAAPAEDIAVQIELDSLSWARDVYFVYAHIGEKLTKAKAGTGARYALWDYAKKNTADFISNMLPKAMVILDRQKAKGSDDETISAAETKSIKEIQKLLAAAVKEAEQL
jgi:hypothetical protein